MLQAGEGEAVSSGGFGAFAVQQAMQHAGGEGVARTDAIDNPGELNLLRLEALFACINTRGNAMMIAVDRVASCRRDDLQARIRLECGQRGLMAPILAFATEFTAEQKRNVAVIAE